MKRYCSECKFAVGERLEFLKCGRTAVVASARDDLVAPSLTREVSMAYCSLERGWVADDKCGPDARFFEAKEVATNG